jgi:hypothetical protein
MGIEDFKLLKNSLVEIESCQQELSENEEKISGMRDNLAVLKKKEGDLASKLVSSDRIIQMEESLAEMTDEVMVWRKKKNSASNKARKPRKLLHAIEDEYKTKQEKKAGWFDLIAISLSLLLIGSGFNQPFVCDDGHVVENEEVLDGERDCPDGSDEATSGWLDSFTRAEEHNDWVFPVIMLGLILYFFFRWIKGKLGLRWDSSGPTIPSDVGREERNELAEILLEIDEIQESLKLSEKKQHKARNKLDRAKKMPGKFSNVQQKIESMETKIEVMVAKNAALQVKIASLFNGIKHLVPYANLLQLSE